MAPSTRSSAESDKLDELMQQLSQFQVTFSTKMDEVFMRVAALEGRSPHSSPHSSTNHDSHHKHFLKLDVPRFDGTDPHGWIFKVS